MALVTGGARGQGEAEARLFAAEGAKVVAADVRADAGEALAAELGDDVVFFRHDVSSESSWDAAVGTVLEANRRLGLVPMSAARLLRRRCRDASIAAARTPASARLSCWAS